MKKCSKGATNKFAYASIEHCMERVSEPLYFLALLLRHRFRVIELRFLYPALSKYRQNYVGLVVEFIPS